jgi:ribosome-associated heat shock protein Hsp15
VDETRVDKWLWAVRICKTRTAASDACRGGHVKVNGAPAKAATPVRVGDTVEAYIHDRARILEVVRIIEKRVGAPTAAECLVDSSPPPPTRDEAIAAILLRDAGTGRPTKRDRRQLDRFRTRYASRFGYGNRPPGRSIPIAKPDRGCSGARQ